jgi:hypothetical protein
VGDYFLSPTTLVAERDKKVNWKNRIWQLFLRPAVGLDAEDASKLQHLRINANSESIAADRSPDFGNLKMKDSIR